MARRKLDHEEKRERQQLLAFSDKELEWNLNSLHRRLNPKARNRIQKPSMLRDFFDADQIRCVRKGLTPGFRRYEVLEGPLGRTILVFAPNAVYQKGPLRWSIVTNFIWGKAGQNIPARNRKGPHQPAQKVRWMETMPTQCHVMAKFIEAFNEAGRPDDGFAPLEVDLEGTYAPELREIRLRRIVDLVFSMTLGEDECQVPIPYREASAIMQRLQIAGRGQHAGLVSEAFAVSELENTVLRANTLGARVRQIIGADPMTYMLFSMKLKEII
jgi:hypothetical protein